MRVVVQRVSEASVKVSEKIVGKINYGYMLLVSFTNGDTSKNIDDMVKKIINLRIMDDENGVMNKNILDVQGEVLSISQFTLYADTKKGNRPSYINALNPHDAIELYKEFNQKMRQFLKVEEGIFGESMQVSLVNDGPITILLER